jgi:hypothetical protein
MKFESLAKADPNALVSFRNLARLMAPRARHFLHDGWFHSHPSCIGHCCRPSPCHPGPKTDYLIAESQNL